VPPVKEWELKCSLQSATTTLLDNERNLSVSPVQSEPSVTSIEYEPTPSMASGLARTYAAASDCEPSIDIVMFPPVITYKIEAA